jgi:hypothetical protein
VTISLAAGEAAPLPACQSVLASTIPDGVEYGVDLFGWGAFDDVTADGERDIPMHWVVNSRSDGEPLLVEGRGGAPTDDALQIIAEANLGASARFVSRVPIEQHRWFDEDGRPIDGAPTRELEFDIRRSLGADPIVDIGVFNVADEDPTSDPESTMLRELTLPIVIRANAWERVRIPIAADQFATDAEGRTVDAAMVVFRAQPDILQTVWLDNVRVMEWRPAPTVDDVWVEADALRSDRDRVVAVTATGCGSR